MIWFEDPARPTRRTLTIGVAATLASCRRRPKDAPIRIRIGYQRTGVLLLAKSRRLEVAVGRTPIRVDWLEFQSGPPLLEAMAAGAVDLGATGDTPPIFAQAAGAALRYVAVQSLTGASEAVLVPTRSPLRDVKDLRGKRIGFTKGSSSHLLVVETLQGAGLRLSDVQPIYLSPGDAASAFGSGAIDAWAIWDPYFALAQRDQGARVLATGAQAPTSSAFLLASSRLVETAPAALRAVLDSLRTTATWGNSNPDRLVAEEARAEGLPPEVVRTSLRRGPLAVDPVTPGVIAQQQRAADTFAAISVIPRRIDVAASAWTDWRPTT